MLVIGNKKFRNLPEQVGFNTQQIEEINKQLDGMVVEDHLVLLDASSGTLTDEEFNTLDAPLSFISYNDRLYIKRAETGSQIIFDSCELLADEVGGAYYALGQWAVTITVSTKEYTIQKHQILNIYSKSQLDSLFNDKLNVSDLLDKTYPVGAIYISVNNTSPAGLFGGSWTSLGKHYLLTKSVSVYTGQNEWTNDGNECYNMKFRRTSGDGSLHSGYLATGGSGEIFGYGTVSGVTPVYIAPTNLYANTIDGTPVYLFERVA